jgi:hypothetical protein
MVAARNHLGSWPRWRAGLVREWGVQGIRTCTDPSRASSAESRHAYRGSPHWWEPTIPCAFAAGAFTSGTAAGLIALNSSTLPWLGARPQSVATAAPGSVQTRHGRGRYAHHPRRRGPHTWKARSWPTSPRPRPEAERPASRVQRGQQHAPRLGEPVTRDGGRRPRRPPTRRLR